MNPSGSVQFKSQHTKNTVRYSTKRGEYPWPLRLSKQVIPHHSSDYKHSSIEKQLQTLLLSSMSIIRKVALLWTIVFNRFHSFRNSFYMHWKNKLWSNYTPAVTITEYRKIYRIFWLICKTKKYVFFNCICMVMTLW